MKKYIVVEKFHSLVSGTLWNKGDDFSPEAMHFKIYLENGYIERVKELPEIWVDLESVGGYFSDSNSSICHLRLSNPDAFNKNLFPTREEAEACLALSQLCQLRDAYNGCDYTDVEDFSFKIYFFRFKTPELMNDFKENLKDLIEIAKPLLALI